MSKELSYFRLSLLSYLKDSHSQLVNDTAFIVARGDAAAETYSKAIKNGQTHDQAGEIANEVLYAGLLFSPYQILIRILWEEFEKEITPALAERVAAELLPNMNGVFDKYHLTDHFDTTPEYNQLYTELTGAIQILFEDGI
jgi:hypothetical protein